MRLVLSKNIARLMFLFALWFAHSASAIDSGQSLTGTIATPGGVDSYTFTAAVGESFTVQVAELSGAGFDASIEVRAPGGAYINQSSNGYDVFTWTPTVAGTYTVEVFDFGSGVDTGSYRISLFVGNRGVDQGALTSGGTLGGSLSLGDLDSYQFDLNAGESYTLQIAETAGSLDAVFEVFGPDGSYLNQSSNGYDVFTGTAVTGGTYSVVVFDFGYSDVTGSYALSFVKGNGAVDQGTLTSGTTVTASLGLGDLNSYQISLNAGESYTLQIAEITGAWDAAFEVIGPDGSYLNQTSNGYDVFTGTAAVAGTYTVVVFDFGYSDVTGDYALSFVKGNGAVDQGTLTSGTTVAGSLGLGDLNSYEFLLNAGESYALQIAETGGSLDAVFEVIGPDGSYLNQTSNGYDVFTGTAAVGGVYSLVVFDFGYSDLAGSYALSFVKGNGAVDQGTLASGITAAGSLGLGDLNSYQFSMNAGDSYTLQIAETGGAWDAAFEVMAPDGSYINQSSNGYSSVSRVATLGGTYSLIVFDFGYSDVTGSYVLDYSRAPGGISVPAGPVVSALSNGGRVDGALHVANAIDKFQRPVTAGQYVQLRLAELGGNSSSINPVLQVFDSSGNLIAQDSAAVLAEVEFVAEASTTLTVAAINTSSGLGNYSLFTAVASAGFGTPSGDDGGVIGNGSRILGNLTVGDLDLFSLDVVGGSLVRIALSEASGNSSAINPVLRIFDSSGNPIAVEGATIKSEVSFIAEQDDTVFVLASNNGTAGSAAYELTAHMSGQPFSVPAGDSGGPVSNGNLLTGTVTRSDVDAYTISVKQDEWVAVRLAEAGSANSSGVSPRLEVFGEDGRLLLQGAASILLDRRYRSELDEQLTIWASNTGTTDSNYELQASIASQAYATSAGDQGGGLTSGVVVSGNLARGDMDLFTIDVVAGTDVSVTMSETGGNSSSFNPTLRIYRPSGALLATGSAAVAATAAFRAPANEQLLVVATNDGSSSLGNYDIVASNVGGDPDGDLDGLTDSQESTEGTNALNPDTDSDGMPDGFEVATPGLNPLIDDAAGDLDGDNVTNLEEFENGTDPNVPNNALPGDVNNDGLVDVADILLLQRHLRGLITLDAAASDRVDLYPAGTPDGVLDVSDLLALTRQVTGN
ncbi:MAG: hypothetical protein AB8C02_05795 [Halioglobus sp.]